MEIHALFQKKPLDIVGLNDVREVSNYEARETGSTFAENAALKAQIYGRLSGLITLADDSGLSVTALEGRPGVYSKRYGDTDTHRIEKLLQEMSHISDSQRQAWFTCSMALYDPSADKLYHAEGRVDGLITKIPQGKNGFGFDPVFFCPEIGKTFGEATSEEKNKISHRARALTKVAEIIRKHFARKK